MALRLTLFICTYSTPAATTSHGTRTPIDHYAGRHQREDDAIAAAAAGQRGFYRTANGPEDRAAAGPEQTMLDNGTFAFVSVYRGNRILPRVGNAADGLGGVVGKSHTHTRNGWRGKEGVGVRSGASNTQGVGALCAPTRTWAMRGCMSVHSPLARVISRRFY